MRRHLAVAGGAVSQDQAYYLGHNAYYKPPDFLAQPVVLNAVLASLEDRDANVRAAALDALRKVHGIEQQQSFRDALAKLQQERNQRLQLIAERVLAGSDADGAAFRRAAELALADARPSGENAFKIELARRIVARSLSVLPVSG